MFKEESFETSSDGEAAVPMEVRLDTIPLNEESVVVLIVVVSADVIPASRDKDTLIETDVVL